MTRPLCPDCPDPEACADGWTCLVVRAAAAEDADEQARFEAGRDERSFE